MELIDIALKCSGWAWDNLREARNCEHQIGEESLTDLILLRFKKHGQVYRSFWKMDWYESSGKSHQPGIEGV